MKEIANKYIIALLSVIMVCLMAAPVMAGCACDVSTNGACSFGTNGTVNGTVHVDGNNHPDTIGDDPDRTFYSEFDVPNGTIKWARLYWHIWGGTYGDYGWSNATFCNASGGTFTNNRFIDDEDCYQTDYDGWYKGGCGTHWLYWNVTDNVSIGQNNLTVNNSGDASWDGRVMYMVLVVVLDDMEGYPPTNYWINQGYMDIDTEESHTTWFNGTINNSASATNLTLWHLSLCSNGNLSIWFNETLVKNYPYGTGFGSDLPEPTPEIIDKDWVDGTAQNMTWENIADPWLHPVMAILVDYTPPTDLIVTGITDPDPLRPDKNSTVNATIKNTGDDDVGKFNVSLYIDGDNTENDTQSVPSLGAGKSITVSFAKVDESYGCHSFRVFVDSDGDVTETNDANNNMTKDLQVGYVIVVESDSDFEKLNTSSGSAPLPSGCFKNESGTYYIQNLTIENYAGVGITIKNTNKKFVINNCTIENCTDSGVFFHNLKNGTINGSTVQNNTKYGIELGLVSLGSDDPEFVNITNNKIEENLYGIGLIGFNCTVSNNTVTNNTGYGIYMLADDTNITSNVIQNNTDYGVKLYNSSRNYVYCNNFTDNNASNSGHQACDNGNTNNWNTTTTGNNWSDWQSNPGYPYYSIDCGNNKDHAPNGAITITLQVDDAKLYCRNVGGDDVTSYVNTSNDGYADVEVKNSYRVGNVTLNFSGSTSGTINSAIFNYEHREDNQLDGIWIEVLDANGTWVYYSATKSGSDSNSSCDITGTIDTTDEANNASIRYVCEEGGGASRYGHLDYANLIIAYTP